MKIAGVDEAGRGPLAGPVVAAAVILDPNFTIEGLNDSKKLSAKKREQLEEIIKEKALSWNVVFVDHHTIDRINILQATLQAMSCAVEGLHIGADFVRVDGNILPKINRPAEAIIKGDELHPEISAASILAKVARDRFMVKLDEEFPQYGFGIHKGYGTKAHQQAIVEHGVSPYHRHTFLRKLLAINRI